MNATNGTPNDAPKPHRRMDTNGNGNGNSNRNDTAFDKCGSITQGKSEGGTYALITNDVFIAEPFPIKLHKVLAFSSTNDLSHVISWNQDGTSFKVHKPEEFENQVMGTFFRQSKFKSFMRQLHLYDFKRTSSKKAAALKGWYQHRYFVQNRTDLARFIFRKNRKPLKSMKEDERIVLNVEAGRLAAEKLLMAPVPLNNHKTSDHAADTAPSSALAFRRGPSSSRTPSDAPGLPRVPPPVEARSAAAAAATTLLSAPSYQFRGNNEGSFAASVLPPVAPLSSSSLSLASSSSSSVDNEDTYEHSDAACLHSYDVPPATGSFHITAPSTAHDVPSGTLAHPASFMPALDAGLDELYMPVDPDEIFAGEEKHVSASVGADAKPYCSRRLGYDRRQHRYQQPDFAISRNIAIEHNFSDFPTRVSFGSIEDARASAVLPGRRHEAHCNSAWSSKTVPQLQVCSSKASAPARSGAPWCAFESSRPSASPGFTTVFEKIDKLTFRCNSYSAGNNEPLPHQPCQLHHSHSHQSRHRISLGGDVPTHGERDMLKGTCPSSTFMSPVDNNWELGISEETAVLDDIPLCMTLDVISS